MRRVIIAFGLCFIWACGLSHAQSFTDAEAALQSGEYAEAARLGEELATADGYALAAEAINAQILLCRVEKLKKNAKASRKLATKALKISPEHSNALLQYALAEGFVTRSSSPITVWRKKLPQKLKTYIAAYETVTPDDPRSLAFLGAWHFGIVRRAGEKRAKDWYGATAQEGIAAYESALKRSPHDIIISTNYAFSILEHDPEKYAPQVIEILQGITKLDTKNALERDVKTFINENLGYLIGESADLKAATKGATYFLDGGS
ncbi:MAG: hypothetical protein ACPGVT_13170 [Maricaulaceae bacterium]